MLPINTPLRVVTGLGYLIYHNPYHGMSLRTKISAAHTLLGHFTQHL